MNNFIKGFKRNWKINAKRHAIIHTVIQTALGFITGSFASALAVGNLFTLGLALVLTIFILTVATIGLTIPIVFEGEQNESK